MTKKKTFIYIETKESAGELTRQEIVDNIRKSIDRLQREDSYRDKYIEGFKTARLVKDEIMTIKNGIRLDRFCDVTQGVTVGGEGCLDIFHIKGEKVKIGDKVVTLEDDLVLPVLSGGDVKRWYIEWDNGMLIYPYDSNGKPVELGDFREGESIGQIRQRLSKSIATGSIRYNNVALYLIQFFEMLSKREFEGEPLSSYGKKWFELHRPRDPQIITSKPKIVCTRMMETNRFALDTRGFLALDSCMVIVPKARSKEMKEAVQKVSRALGENDDNKVRVMFLKYLLGILNSSITELLMKLSVPFLQGRYYQVSENFLSEIPIVISKSPAVIRQVVSTVDACMEGKKVDNKLDEIIYKLYNMDAKNKKNEIRQYISTH